VLVVTFATLLLESEQTNPELGGALPFGSHNFDSIWRMCGEQKIDPTNAG
jgi:hypothetical protein